MAYPFINKDEVDDLLKLFINSGLGDTNRVNFGVNILAHINEWLNLPLIPRNQELYVYKIGFIGVGTKQVLPVKPLSNCIKFKHLVPYLDPDEVSELTSESNVTDRLKDVAPNLDKKELSKLPVVDIPYYPDEPIALPIIHYNVKPIEKNLIKARVPFKFESILVDVASQVIFANSLGRRSQILPLIVVHDDKSHNYDFLYIKGKEDGVLNSLESLYNCLKPTECYNDNCRNKENLKACRGCNKVAYCCKKCRIDDWEIHHKYFCNKVIEIQQINKSE